jgi:anti-sigma regulatory factor (Ser/Thr protein kinase)/PAS domain-containing protein
MATEVALAWQLELPAEPRSIADIRNGVTEFAVGQGAEPSVVGDIALAVTEAATNAVLHAFIDRPAGRIDTVARAGDGVIVVQVMDDGRGMRPRSDSPGLGLGLPTIGQLTKSCDIRERPGGQGTEVRMTFVVPGVHGPDEAPGDAGDERLGLLGAISRLVEGGGWPGEGVERLIDLLVPAVADAAVIDLVDANGDPHRLGARVSGTRAGELSRWLAGRRPRRDQLEAALAALRAGDWRLVAIDATVLDQMAHDDADARAMASIDAAWWLNMPLGSGDRLLGSLGLAFSAERGDPTGQRSFLEAAAERVARGLENTQLVASLRSTRRRLERVLDALSEAVTVSDAQGRVVYANAAAVTLLGAGSVDEVLASSTEALMDRFHVTREDGSPVGQEDLPGRRVIRGQPAEPLLTRSVDRTTGRERWLLTKATLLDDEGPLSVNIIEDVTELR